jgi:phenylacetate-CoA ligase
MNLYEKILSLFYRVVKNDRRILYYTELSKNLNLNRNAIIKKQEKNLKALINHAYYKTEYYKKLFDENNITPKDIKTKDDLIKIPELTKQIIKNNINELKSKDNFSKKLVKVTSGGSSGEQAIIFYSKYYEEISRASWLRNNSMIGWMPTDKTVWIWGSPIEHAKLDKSIIGRVGMLLNRRIIFNAFNYSETDFVVWCNRIVKFKPKVLYGYASILLEFSQFLIEKNLNLPSIKIVVSTAEKLINRETIEKAFNCKVYNQYGCREVVAVGIEVGTNEMVLTDDVVLLNTNKNNEFLLTPLFSFGFPLINYKVGDIGDHLSERTKTNKYPFPTINLLIGRITDNFINNKNRKIATSALSTYLSTLNLEIKEHQIIQNNYTEFTINFISCENTNKENYYKKITLCLEEYFGNNLSIIFNQVLKIPVEKSGKRLMFKRTFKL